jgi:hypothetical protein
MPTEFKLGLNILRTFKTQQNRHHFAIGEFIDNSVQSYMDNKEALNQIPGFKPTIKIFVSPNEISIEDNCAGISKKFEDRAFDIGKPNENVSGIGTYGMGMKVSACWYTDTWTVETKALDEDVIKIWSIDVNKIIDTGNVNIGPKNLKAKNVEPYTKITMSNPHKVPTGQSVKSLKGYIGSMYRFFIIKDEINFEYNGELIKYVLPKRKKISSFPHSAEKPIIDWMTEIPRLDLGDGYWAEGFAFLHEKKNNPRNGFGIFWKNKLIEGSHSNPWVPSSADYDDPEDKKKYAIFGTGNAAVDQRLDGWLHISSKFEVVFTKNQVIWEGRDLILKEKLKAYLKDCIMWSEVNSDLPDDEKNQDLLYQVRELQYLWEPPIDEPDSGPIFNPPSPGPGEVDPKPIPIPPIPPEEEDPLEPEIDIPIDAETVEFTYGPTKWTISIITLHNARNDFIQKTDGPDGESGDQHRTMVIKINEGNPFANKYFTSTENNDAIMGMKKMAVALVLSEVLAKETHDKALTVRRNLNKILLMQEFA